MWKWDQTTISGEYGRKIFCFTSSRSNHGGARRELKEIGKHLTAGIAVAACGKIVPLFIASGKNVMPSWQKPLESHYFTRASGWMHWLCNKNWFPVDTELFVTKHSSADERVVVNVFQNINRHAQKPLPEEEYI